MLTPYPCLPFYGFAVRDLFSKRPRLRRSPQARSAAVHASLHRQTAQRLKVHSITTSPLRCPPACRHRCLLRLKCNHNPFLHLPLLRWWEVTFSQHRRKRCQQPLQYERASRRPHSCLQVGPRLAARRFVFQARFLPPERRHPHQRPAR